ncbi:hypothetical protein J2753_001268 [Halolamina salifodinae]|uniref:Uncharacterized protein n=2 Tax=Halolamina salifodinae TaxID=1202767 RepID=A0A8T4GYY5_9EURY|nr:hypothetical protein [Halolamina salifodinae]
MVQRVTIYLDDKEEFQRYIHNLESEHKAAFSADKWEIYQALFETAQAHEDEVLRRLRESAE